MGLNNKKEIDDGQMTGIDRVIHEHARFRIMAQLYVIESADFLFLMRQTGLTHGNLSAHLRRLEDTGYIEIEKELLEKKPIPCFISQARDEKLLMITGRR